MARSRSILSIAIIWTHFVLSDAAPELPPSTRAQPIPTPAPHVAEVTEPLAEATRPDGATQAPVITSRIVSTTTTGPRGVLRGDDRDAVAVLPGGPKKKRPADVQRANFPDCPATCYQAMLNDGWCNTECATVECGNDQGDCTGWCAPDCKPGWVGDGYCDKDCFRPDCQWDGGDCAHLYHEGDIVFPPPEHEDFDYNDCECESRYLHNGKCDAACDTKECNWDGGDCRHECSAGCSTSWQGDEECDAACFNEACGYDKGDCQDCAPGCRPDRIGNGICDGPCMNAECHWDMGDCAGVCHVYPVDYTLSPFEYNLCRNEWTGDGACDCFCMNKECHYDYNDCLGTEAECMEIVKRAEDRVGATWPLAESSEGEALQPGDVVVVDGTATIEH